MLGLSSRAVPRLLGYAVGPDRTNEKDIDREKGLAAESITSASSLFQLFCWSCSDHAGHGAQS